MSNVKQTVTISIRPNIWKAYQKYCKKNNLVPSYEFEAFMKSEIDTKI